MSKHEYLMSAEKYFGTARFQVEADSKEEAKAKGIEYMNRVHGKDNWITGTVKVDRKLKPSFGEES
jgi:hypothetical protein